ncbi:Chaperone protein dnaJ 20, chloroplastic [Sesamum alatum]|uniref:Chaperone protein dnaJ 20, chloroplastic n=1 Tax=Sesamum alatum TaxID=300844 RepID=A0AAE1Z1C6_9LAMI|nr:Chaperone protein dnaJ 20, chloroplastic [Sesamum alatum]
MSCKFTLSNPISSFSNLPTRTRFPQELSFTSQLTKSRISVRNPSGPRRARARIEALYAPAETLYELLGITEGGSSPSDLKKAYRKMARKYHPDVAPPDRVDEHTRRFIMVKEAYETLSDPQTRALYDSDLAGGSGFGFSATSAPYRYDKRMEERGEWRMRWQSQIDELKRRSMNPSRSGRMSWGARMRNQR